MTFGSTPKDSTGIPLGSVYTPGTSGSNLTALEGGPVSTDGNSQQSAPVSTYTKDGSNLSQGATTDAAVTGDTTGTISAKLRGLSKMWADIWDSVNHRIHVDGSGVTQPVQHTDLSTSGTISAAQSSIGTPVANATLSLTVGQGQSSWEAQLIPGGGGFTSASTIVVDVSVDSGTTWFVSSFKVSGSLTTTPVQSVVGTGANIKIGGNAGAKSQVRVRCSVLNSGESVIVTLRGSAGVTDIGLMSSIPAGTNSIGSVTANAGTNLNTSTLALESGGNLATLAGTVSASKVAVTGTFWQTTQPVSLASAPTTPVTGTFWQTTQPVSGTVTANAGTNMSTASLAIETGGNLATLAGAVTSAVVQSNTKQVNGTSTSVNAGNRDGGTQRFIEAGNGTGTVTQVASSATSGVILAANTNKKGTMFFNDSTAILYLLYGTGTASATNYSVKIGAQTLFEDPLHYTGGFNGIWASANGFVNCTEVS